MKAVIKKFKKSFLNIPAAIHGVILSRSGRE
jgi:hypothetical protein